MRALADAVLLAAVAVGSVRSARAMLRASWPRRSPAAAILLWQALGLAGGLAAVGALLAIGVSGPGNHVGVIGGLAVLVGRVESGQLIAPDQSPVLTALRLTFLMAGFALLAVLYSVLVVAFADAIGARRRQRELLALLAHGDPKVPGALVIDYPAAAAYCLPGIRSQIVVSVGTLDLLAPAELTAVLAHERAHLRARHDLVLIPFTSLRRAFPRSAGVAEAHRTVALLVEMMADDRALRVRGLLPKELATALVRFGTAGADCAPAGALAVAEGELTARVLRLLTPPPPLSRAAQAAVVLTAALVVATPVLLLVTPLRPDQDQHSRSNGPLFHPFGRPELSGSWPYQAEQRSVRKNLDFEFDLPGTVRAAVGRAAALELADLRPDVGQVDRGRDEGDHGEEPDRAAVRGRVEPEHEGHAEDDQPQWLGQLAHRDEGRGGPDDAVDKRPRLDHERRDGERHEEVGQRSVGAIAHD
jgi:Zn-dependent protease with chaperone function